MQSEVFLSWFKKKNAGASTIQHLYQKDFSHFIFIAPNRWEQEKIALALDHLSGGFDRAIELIEGQVKALRNYRASVIHEAVTKGLDPDAPMKDSGVDWIGAIPSHWRCLKIKYVSDISSGSTPSRDRVDYWGGAIPWIKTGELANDVINEAEEHVTQKALIETGLKEYQPGTILVAMYGQGKTRGMTAKLGMSAAINQACAALSTKGEILDDYLWLCLQAGYEALRSKAQGSGQPNLSADYIANFKIPLPDVREQAEIVHKAFAKRAAIDAVIETKQKQFDVLKRRRQSLIYEYVTGKRRVGQEA